MRTDRHLVATVPTGGGDLPSRLAFALAQRAQLESQIGDRKPLLACPPQPLPLLRGL